MRLSFQVYSFCSNNLMRHIRSVKWIELFPSCFKKSKMKNRDEWRRKNAKKNRKGKRYDDADNEEIHYNEQGEENACTEISIYKEPNVEFLLVPCISCARAEVLDSWFDRNGQTMSVFEFFQSNDFRFWLFESNDFRFRLYSTLTVIVRLCSTLLDFVRLCWTLFDFVRLYRTFFDFVRLYRELAEESWTTTDIIWLFLSNHLSRTSAWAATKYNRKCHKI